MPKLDITPDLCFMRRLIRCLSRTCNCWLVVHDLVDTDHRGCPLLEQIHDPAESDHRPRELRSIGGELHKLTQRYAPGNNIETAAPEQNNGGKASDKEHGRPQQCINPGVLDTPLCILLVGGAKGF